MPVFISHARSQGDVAEHVATYLERHGIDTWVAPRDIPPGAMWGEAIANAIKAASGLVLLFSADADASPQVQREILLADKDGLPIYWLRLEQIEPEKLRYFLSATQWIDWMDNRDATLDQLIAALHSPRSDGSARPSPAMTLPSPPGVVQAPPRQATPGWPLVTAVLNDENAAAEVVAHLVFRTARGEPDASVVLPTGRTATRLFRAMVRVAPTYGPRPFGEAIVLTDTETFGVYAKHPTSRSRHVQENLLDKLATIGLAPDPSQVHLLQGIVLEEDPFKKVQRILRDHPPALHVVSISPAGEIIGYEVGAYNDVEMVIHDKCQVIELAETGRRYIDADQPSRSVVTIGMGEMLDARLVVLPVLDRNKARVLRQITRFDEMAGIPASLLRRHSAVAVVTTRAVAESAELEEVRTFADVAGGVEWLEAALR